MLVQSVRTQVCLCPGVISAVSAGRIFVSVTTSLFLNFFLYSVCRNHQVLGLNLMVCSPSKAFSRVQHKYEVTVGHNLEYEPTPVK